MKLTNCHYGGFNTIDNYPSYRTIDNLSTFTESFKRVTGCTPKEYRIKCID